MKIFITFLRFFHSHSFSAENVELSKAPIDLTDNQSLQRGAKTFVNYCLNCHSANYMRYSNLIDIGLSADTIKRDLMLTEIKLVTRCRSICLLKNQKNGLVLPHQIYQWLQDQEELIGFIAICVAFIVIHPELWGGIIRVLLNSAMPHILWELTR